jgi:hypothetical protein
MMSPTRSLDLFDLLAIAAGGGGKGAMDSQQYEQLAEETQAWRVSLVLADLFARGGQARDDARATRAVSRDLRAVAQEWKTVSAARDKRDDESSARSTAPARAAYEDRDVLANLRKTTDVPTSPPRTPIRR